MQKWPVNFLGDPNTNFSKNGRQHHHAQSAVTRWRLHSGLNSLSARCYLPTASGRRRPTKPPPPVIYCEVGVSHSVSPSRLQVARQSYILEVSRFHLCDWRRSLLTAGREFLGVDDLGGKLKTRRLLHTSPHHREGAPTATYTDKLLQHTSRRTQLSCHLVNDVEKIHCRHDMTPKLPSNLRAQGPDIIHGMAP